MTLVKTIHHVSFIIADLEKSLDFYSNTLGMEIDNNRPDLGYEGAWLKVGEQQIHLLLLPNPDPVAGRPEHAGRDRHTAFFVNDIDVIIERLQAQGIQLTMSRSGRKAVFCRDPDGNGLEFIQG